MTTEFCQSTCDTDAEVAARKAAMALLAAGDRGETDAGGLRRLGDLPEHAELRAPESGLVMVRGRIGGDGAPFNLGEATVTRAAVQLHTGEIGYSYVLGRDHKKARLAALATHLADAPLRDASSGTSSRRCAIASRASARRRAQETAATRVDFFTLVRGENAA